MRRAVTLLVLVCAAALLRAAPEKPGVRVWQDTLQLPTYLEAPANPNAPFDLFTFGRFNYPYPLRDGLTDKREVVSWRTLNLENEYLRLTVLPDLGGHIYSCLDKRTGQQMFYANSAIKKALIGYRGAWAAFGVEFNYPVSHNWASMSPVDFATAQNSDGSGSIFVGNTDQVYRGRWRVELRLAPSRTLLEQRVELYNATDVRHRYYWWTNGAVQAWEDSRLVYPTELMATHGFTAIEPWPNDRQGRDMSVIRNQTDGPVSLFTYRTREGFVGVYHPHTKSGTVHIADPAELPVHKVWSWGYDRDAATWREALSDDNSGYVELQAGLFRNQETYAFLEPQDSVRFTEVLAAGAGSRRDHARHAGCDPAHRASDADKPARGARRHARSAGRAPEAEDRGWRAIDRSEPVAARSVAQGNHGVVFQPRARRSRRARNPPSHGRKVRSHAGERRPCRAAAQLPGGAHADELAVGDCRERNARRARGTTTGGDGSVSGRAVEVTRTVFLS